MVLLSVGKGRATLMGAVTGRFVGRVVRGLSAWWVLAVQVVLGVVTVVAAWGLGWLAAVVGVVLMHVLTVVVVLGPWGVRPAPVGVGGVSKSQLVRVERRVDRLGGRLASKGQVARLERRVDLLGARLVSSSERTRVEVLDALAEDRAGSQDRSS